jgi:hypothetical protein
LHVRTHQRTIGVIVFKEWNQRCRDGDQLLRRNVDKLDVLPKSQNKLPGFSRSVTLVNDVAVFIKVDVGLTNDVLVFFPRS